jgi:hypothetical protein
MPEVELSENLYRQLDDGENDIEDELWRLVYAARRET